MNGYLPAASAIQNAALSGTPAAVLFTSAVMSPFARTHVHSAGLLDDTPDSTLATLGSVAGGLEEHGEQGRG